MTYRRVLALALIPYVAWLVAAYRYHFLDGVNLALHEGGHFFFMLFGQTLHVLGGTLVQLLFPVAFVIYFLRQGKRFEAAVCSVWAAESLMYTSRYLGDARVMALPLVGGHMHDWNWLLTRVGMLRHCDTIAGTLHVVASLAAILATFQAFRYSGSSVVTKPTGIEVSGADLLDKAGDHEELTRRFP